MGKLICTDIACARGDFTLKVDFLALEEGEKIALLGENGCGKTTLLHVLAGLLPFTGSVTLGEERWDRLSPERRAEHMVYVPQAAGLLFDLTVAELIELALPGQNPLRGEARQAVLAATEMATFLHRKYHTLSGGEQRRAMLARVLCRDSAFIFLDEPTAPLDLRHAAQLMRHVSRRSAAVIVALHDINLALRYFDRFLLMKDGRIVFDKHKDAVTGEDLEAVYGIRLTRCGDHFLPEL